MTDKQLKQLFHEEIIDLCKVVNKQLKYKSSKLLTMINKYGGYEAAIKYITTDANTFEFSILWEQGRLDLSIEALVAQPKYQELFPESVVTFCENRLKQYNYKPKVIEEKEPEESYNTQQESKQLEITMPLPEQIVEPIYTEHHEISPITRQVWEEVLCNQKIVSDKNRDLLIRMYLMGGTKITPEDLSKEQGYNLQYPYGAVITALAKRIKNAIKIDVPSYEGKSLWWHILFVGYYNDNQTFEWTLRHTLADAIESLIQSDIIDSHNIEVKTDKTHLKGSSEEPIVANKVADEQVQEAKLATPEGPQAIAESIDENEKMTRELSEAEDIDETDDESYEDIPLLEADDDYLLTEDDELRGVQEADLLNDLDDSLDAFIDQLMSNTPSKKEAKPSSTAPKSVGADKAISSHIPSEVSVTKVEQPQQAKTIDQTMIAKPLEKDVEKEDVEKDIIKEETKIKEPSQATEESLEKQVKQACLDYYGAICEVCGFDYGYTYGDQFEQLIKIYSLQQDKPLHTLDPTKDVIPLCHNCEAVIKSKMPHYTVEEIKQLMKK